MRPMIFLTLLVVTCCLVIGCEPMKFEQPKWEQPKWDWWNKDKSVQPDPPSDKLQEPQVREPLGTTMTDTPAVTVDPKKTTISPELAVKIQKLEEHRDKVWKQVCMLQEMDSLTIDQQIDLKRKIIEQLDEWYAPMPVSPPNTNLQAWTDVIIWDFMPETDFQQAVANWRKVAENNHTDFPTNPTRRQLLKFIDNTLKPADEKTNKEQK